MHLGNRIRGMFGGWRDLAGAASWVQLALSIAPFAFSVGFLTLRSGGGLMFGDWDRALVAFCNSLLIAILVSTITLVIATIMVLVERRLLETVIFSLLGLMLPGEFAGLGMDRFLALTMGLEQWRSLKILCFVLAVVGFVFPYVASSLILSIFSVPKSEQLAVAELSPNKWRQIRIILISRKQQLILAWIIGINLSVSEVARTRILGEDVFGLGSQFFGPLVVDAFQARGLEQVYFFLSYVLFAAIVSAVILLSGRFKRAREGAPIAGL